MDIVWIATAIAFLLLAAHPFVTYPVSLLIAKRTGRFEAFSHSRATSISSGKSIAICLSAHNEEAVIRRKLENLLSVARVTRAEVDVLVYLDGCTDRTLEAAQAFEDRITLLVGASRHGKSYAMNTLVGEASADIIVFTDANVFLDESALNNLLRHFEDESIGCVCGHLIYTNSDESLTAEIGAHYWRFEEILKELETDTGSTMGADGSLFGIRRGLFRQVPENIIDDMFTSVSILCDGYRVIRADDVCARERGAVSAKEEFRRKVRIACRAFNCHRLLWPSIKQVSAWNRYKYVSHKFLRWVVLYNLVIAYVSLVLGVSIATDSIAPLLLSVFFVGLVVVAAFVRVPFLSKLANALSAFLATAIGVWLSLRGETFQTWNPVDSAR